MTKIYLRINITYQRVCCLLFHYSIPSKYFCHSRKLATYIIIQIQMIYNYVETLFKILVFVPKTKHMCKVMQQHQKMMQKHKTSGIDYCQSVFGYAYGKNGALCFCFKTLYLDYSFAKWVISDLVLDYENIIYQDNPSFLLYLPMLMHTIRFFGLDCFVLTKWYSW